MLVTMMPVTKEQQEAIRERFARIVEKAMKVPVIVKRSRDPRESAAALRDRGFTTGRSSETRDAVLERPRRALLPYRVRQLEALALSDDAERPRQSRNGDAGVIRYKFYRQSGKVLVRLPNGSTMLARDAIKTGLLSLEVD
jgi:hypothetical protein